MSKYYSESGRFVEAQDFKEARRLLLQSHPSFQQMVEDEEMGLDGLLVNMGWDGEEERMEAHYGDIATVLTEKEQGYKRRGFCGLFLCWDPNMLDKEDQPDLVAVVLALNLEEALASCPPGWMGKPITHPTMCPRDAIREQAYYWPGLNGPLVSWTENPEGCGGGWDFCQQLVAEPLYEPHQAAILYTEPKGEPTAPLIFDRGDDTSLPAREGKVGIQIENRYVCVSWPSEARVRGVEYNNGKLKCTYWMLPARLPAPKGGQG